jgi:hypothetical protein
VSLYSPSQHRHTATCWSRFSGNDEITANDGSNIILAGAFSDTVTSGAGHDLICGDHCHIKCRKLEDFVGVTGNFTKAAGVPWQLDFVVTIDPVVTGGMLWWRMYTYSG